MRDFYKIIRFKQSDFCCNALRISDITHLLFLKITFPKYLFLYEFVLHFNAKTMATRFLILALGLCVSSLVTAQDLSWKKHVNLAEDFNKEGKYAEAADNYEKAWKKRTKDKDLIFNAGEAYYQIKDYRKAAEAYANVKDENSKYPLVGLKYARSLKQDGQYDKAKREFNNFYQNYTGESKNILEEIIKTEVQGTEMGMKAASMMDKKVEIRYPEGVNSASSDFAPFSYADDVLYFSSTMGGKARIYRSQRSGNKWSKASTPENFPVIQNDQHYGNSSLSASGNRFYFTICSGDKPWGDLTARCEIFVLKRRNNTWAQPERLPDFVNMDKTTATHPNVVQQGNREILYFASNREGGRGGMDLWYTSRDISNDNSEFSFPINVGSPVNTLGDEITPFYDVVDGTLYFASNGLASIGGFDIFNSKGDGTRWATPENKGMPLNSGADDYFFAQNKSGSGGFLVSNRTSGSQKTTTRDEDIFEFTSNEKRISLKGSVYDKASGSLVPQATVTLFEVNGNNENLVDRKSFTDGTYLFDIKSGKTFKVLVESNEYAPYNFTFTADDPTLYVYGQPVYMDKSGGSTAITDPGTEPAVVKTPKTNPTKKEDSYIVRGKSKEDNLEIVTSAPRHQGVYYRIQLVAVKKYDSEAASYTPVKETGQLQTEFIVDKKLTRVLIGDYFTKEEVMTALDRVKQQGFEKAFIVQYEDGERFGQVKM